VYIIKRQEVLSIEEDRDFLTTFSFICMLSFDVYMKKMIIEKLIDMSGVKDVQKMKKKKEESASAKAKTEEQKKEKTE
ncbi:MAG TPA: hypothetical protein VHP81_08030, partial [Lachnospiraceae bacterium]|nr:hypothetical protein [Lachnospiraceae bacterium]